MLQSAEFPQPMLDNTNKNEKDKETKKIQKLEK